MLGSGDRTEVTTTPAGPHPGDHAINDPISISTDSMQRSSDLFSFPGVHFTGRSGGAEVVQILVKIRLNLGTKIHIFACFLIYNGSSQQYKTRAEEPLEQLSTYT
jgi:hypothetical protein